MPAATNGVSTSQRGAQQSCFPLSLDNINPKVKEAQYAVRYCSLLTFYMLVLHILLSCCECIEIYLARSASKGLVFAEVP